MSRPFGRALSLAAAAILAAGCATGPASTPSDQPSRTDEGWSLEESPAEWDTYERSLGWPDLGALSATWAADNRWVVPFPGHEPLTLDFMHHGIVEAEGWTQAEDMWGCCSPTNHYLLGHGFITAFGPDSSFELQVSSAGMEGIVGIRGTDMGDGPGTYLFTWVIEDDLPRQVVHVERVDCFRPQDYTWIYGCGHHPVLEGQYAPM